MTDPTDEQIRMMYDLQPGKKFVVAGERHVFELESVRNPVEGEPVLVCWEMEGPARNRTKRMKRAFRLSMLVGVLPD